MMRAVALATVLSLACGPKVKVESPFEIDDPRAGAPGPRGDEDEDADGGGEPDPAALSTAPARAQDRPVAPPGARARTGTIDRTRLFAVLDGGPGLFLRGFEVVSALESERFVGWQLVQVLDDASPVAQVDVEPGDVLVAVNGLPVSRPDQLMVVWDGLRTANQLVCDLRRGDGRLQLRFAIEPAVGRTPPDLPVTQVGPGPGAGSAAPTAR